MPDPDAQAMRKCLAEFYPFAAAHDTHLTARGLEAHEVSETLAAVAVLRTWLQRYSG
jgi:hypothetical protein